MRQTTAEYSEERLLRLLEQRDEQGLKTLDAEYGKLCRSIAFDILGSREDAEECFNDALMRVWNTVPPVQPESMRAYLVTIVRRLAINRYRADHAQRRGGSQMPSAIDELAEILISDESVEQELDRRTLRDGIMRFLQTLPQETQSVFLQRYWMMRPVSEIAEAGQITKSKVKMTLLRTRNKLKEFLMKEGLL